MIENKDFSNIAFTARKLMEDDCLKFLRILASDIPQSKIFKILLSYVLLVHSGVFVATTYFMLFKFNSRDIMHYFLVHSGTTYLLLVCIYLLFKDNFLILFDGFPLWSFSNADSKMRNDILKEIKLLNFLAVSVLFFGYIACIFFFKPNSNDDDIFFAFHLNSIYFPNHAQFGIIIYKITYPLVPYLMVIHSYQTVYYVQHLAIQMRIFNAYLSSLGSTTLDEKSLMYSEEYQQNVYYMLLYCIKRHQEFINLQDKTVVYIKSMIVTFSVCGILLGLATFVFTFSDMMTPEYYPRMVLLSVATVITFCTIIWSGQKAETEANSSLDALSKIKWYNFNKSNATLYLIFLINLSKTRRIEFSENYAVNYEFGLAIVKSIYSLLTVMLQMYD